MPRDAGRRVWGERRKSFRVEWNSPATIYDVDRHLERPCILADFSTEGAKLIGIRANTIPDEFRLRTPLGERLACRVLWRTENALGVRFMERTEARSSSTAQRATMDA
jgi:PilZ domain